MSEREILFRGKRCDNGDWVYGDVAHSIRSANGRKPHKSWIVNGYFSNGGWLTPLTRYAVIDETVGQYTGLTDKNGTRIFEGDIIDVVYNPNYGGVAKKRIGTFKVGFEDGCYVYEDGEGYFLFTESDEIVVIGNIYDNPELLKGE